MANRPLPDLHLLTSPDWVDYELLDSGDGNRLERFGPYVLSRPEAEAIWRPSLGEKTWGSAHATFIPSAEENGGHWKVNHPLPEFWVMGYKGLRFRVQLSASRHVGVFPEQACQWDWIEEQTQMARRRLHVLNLFGYTGLASLAAARGGAQVTHVDASKKVITWAKENQTLSNLQDLPVRWIVDDVLKFVQREARRGVRYDGIILDPPKFGRGPKGEVWEFYKLIPNLLQSCVEILTDRPQFLLVTAYAVKASAVTLYNAVSEVMQGRGGVTSAGEVLLMDNSDQRALSMAIYTRWTAVDEK